MENDMLVMCFDDSVKSMPEEEQRLYSLWTDDDKFKYMKLRMEKAALYKAMQKTMVDKYSRYLSIMFDNGNFDEIFTHIKDVREYTEEIVDKKDNPQWWFITINCDYKEVPFETFKKVVEKAVIKKWIEEYVYVYEQRGNGSEEKPVGMGYHVHLLIKRKDGKRLSEIYREMKSTFSKVCKADNSEILNFRKLHSVDDVKKAYAYLNGDKDLDGDKSYKKESLEKNFEWRESLNLKQIYKSSDEHPSILVRGATDSS